MGLGIRLVTPLPPSYSPVMSTQSQSPLFLSAAPPLTKAANVAIHPNIVKVVFCCIHLTRITLRDVLHCKDVLLAILGIVIEVDFGIKTDNYGKQAPVGSVQ